MTDCKHGIPEEWCAFCLGQTDKSDFSGISENDSYTDMMNSRKHGTYFKYADDVNKGNIN